MKLHEIVKEAEEAEDELNFKLDDEADKKANEPEANSSTEKPTEDDTEHKHPNDFKDKIVELFSKAKSDGTLVAYDRAETVQIRSAQDGEQIEVNYPGEVPKTRVAKKGEFVLRNEENPTQLKILSKQELDSEFEPDTAEVEPDAEGFVKYIPKGQLIAFEYNEQVPLKLKDDKGLQFIVQHGDYLGYPSNDSRMLIRLDKAHFEKRYRLAA